MTVRFSFRLCGFLRVTIGIGFATLLTILADQQGGLQGGLQGELQDGLQGDQQGELQGDRQGEKRDTPQTARLKDELE